MTGRITIADGILLDPIRLAETRALIQASSGRERREPPPK